MSSPRVAIVIYSLYGHIAKRKHATSQSRYPNHPPQSPNPSRRASKQPAVMPQSTSPSLTHLPFPDSSIVRIPETLSTEILTKMHAPPKPDYPVFMPADLTKYDAYLFGIPTRYGNFPAQWKVRSFHSVPHPTISPPASGILGCDRTTLGYWCPGRQVCRRLRLHGYPRWWSRINRYQLALDARPPWDYIRPPGLQPHVCTILQCERSSRWCVFFSCSLVYMSMD